MDQVSNPDSQDCSCSEAQRTVIGLRRLVYTSISILHLGCGYLGRRIMVNYVSSVLPTYIVVCIRFKHSNPRYKDWYQMAIILLELT